MLLFHQIRDNGWLECLLYLIVQSTSLVRVCEVSALQLPTLNRPHTWYREPIDVESPGTCITQTTPKTRVLVSCSPFHVLSTSFTLIFAGQHREAKVLQHAARVSQSTVQAMQPAGS